MKILENNDPLKAIICGFEHSGTTLVSEILRQHPKLDSGFEGGFLLNETAEDFLKTEPFYTNAKGGWGISDEDLKYITAVDNWPELYERLREKAEVIKNKNTWLFDKTPRYMRYLPQVLARVPNVRCIVIVKDIRAVFWSSFKRKKLTMDEWHKTLFKPTSNHTLAMAKGWKQAIDSGFSDRILLIQYEELCLNQVKTSKNIFDFLKLEFNNSYLNFKSKRYNHVYSDQVSKHYIKEYQDNLPTHICEEILNLINENEFEFIKDWLFVDEDDGSRKQKKIFPANDITGHESDDEAEYYRQIALKKPHYAGSYFNWGVALLKAKRFLEAQGVIHKAVEMNPVFCESSFVFNTLRNQLELAFETCKNWAWPAVQLGVGFLRRNQLDKAEAYLQNMLECCTIFDAYTYARGFECLCQIIFTQNGSNTNTASLIKDICLKDIEKHGKQAWSSLYLGAVFKIEGNLSEAYRHFEKAANSNLVSSFTHAGRGCSSLKHYQILNNELRKVESEQKSWISKYLSDIIFYEEPKHIKESSVLLLTCCDPKYFSMFSENLAYSCFKHNSNVSLHFHIVNPEQSTFELWESLKESLPNQGISLSYENINIKNLKVYYTMVRFLRVTKFIERYNKDIIMIDSDSVVTSNLSPFIQATKKFDVCLNIKQDENYFPWRSIPAGLVFVAANQNSQVFFAAVSQYMEIVFQPNSKQSLWWIDQNALFAAYHWCQQFKPFVKICNVWSIDKGMPFDFALASHHKKEDFIARYRAVLGIHNHNILPQQKLEGEELDKGIININKFKEQINVDPESSHFYKILGDKLTREGCIEQAIASYKIATYKENLKCKPEFVKQYWNQGKIIGPNFLVIGAAKAGTNSIFQYLNQHPLILPCAGKEISFYHRYKRGILSYDWYLAHFPPIPLDKGFQTGEASADSLYKDIQQQVQQLYPNIKLIALLRNPVERTISHYYHFLKVKRESRSLEEAINTELSQLNNLSENELSSSPDKGYIRQSLYVYQLKRWMAYFSKDQLLILKSEDLFTKPAIVIESVFHFLDLPNYRSSQYQKYNAGSYSLVSQELRSRLADFFDSHNHKLEEYLGIKFNWNMRKSSFS